MTEQEMFIEALMSQFMEPEFQFPDIGRRVAELSIQNNDMTWRIWQAARATPSDPNAKLLSMRPTPEIIAAMVKYGMTEKQAREAYAVVMCSVPCATPADHNNYPGLVRGEKVYAKDRATEQATPADQDALDAQRYRWLQRQGSKVWYQVAQMRMNETGEFIDSAIAADAAKGN